MKYGFNSLLRAAPVWLLVLFCFAFAALPGCAQESAAPSAPVFVKADLVVVHKAKRTLELWAKGEKIAKYRIALGFNPVGPKEYEGDGKTPEGVYTIIRRNEASHYYKSLQLDYPNAADVAAAKAKGLTPGGLIMIHGLPNNKSAERVGHPDRDWTDGCIALDNPEMQNIWNRVDVGTAVLVMP